MRLFDERERVDGRPARYTEGGFAFLNRVDGAYWGGVRDELENWYAEFPDPTGDVRGRYRKADIDQHYPAWWELYLHRLFCRLGFDVEVHPLLSASGDRPDFRLSVDGQVYCYVEARVVFSGIVPDPRRHGPREAEALDTIDAVSSSHFTVLVDFEAVGAESVPRAKLRKQVADWLSKLDPDSVDEAAKAGAPVTTTLAIRDWAIRLRALRAVDAPYDRHRRLIGGGPPSGGMVNDRQKLGAAFAEKAAKYGDLDAPLVIAAWAMSPHVEHEDVADALFGTTAVALDGPDRGRTVRACDGFWVRTGPVNRHVAAVLVASLLGDTVVGTRWPRLWLNPFTGRSLDVSRLPFPTARVEDERLVLSGAAREPWEVFGLPPDWPGPGPRFSASRRGVGPAASS